MIAARLLAVALPGILLAACVVDETPAAMPASAPAATEPVGASRAPQEGRFENFAQADKAACEARGGSYGRRGRAGLYSCAVTYADAGKVCRKADDCEGQCRVEDSASAPSQGQCQATSDRFGCYTFLDEQGQPVGICVD